MTEKPILFKPELVRAILDGRKVMTRRIVKGRYLWTTSPYKEGMQLWVRETFAKLQCVCDAVGQPLKSGCIKCNADRDRKDLYRYRATADHDNYSWKPSIHMPRIASRLTLEITSVTVERACDISEEDAIAEGVRPVTKDGQLTKYCIFDCGDMSSVPWSDMPLTAKEAFQQAWCEINGESTWDNWCWVISFKKI